MNRRLAVLPALAAVLLLAGCSGTAKAASPTTSTVKGSVTLSVSATTGDSNYLNDSTNQYQSGTDCTAASGYDDIATGAEVDVVDGAGKVLAIGHLEDGLIDSDGYSCRFGFQVPDVPKIDGVYGVKVGNSARGIVHFTRAELLAGPALTIGS